MAMVTSENGRNLIKQWEGLYLTAYKNKGETYWTIGYGHYGADVYEGMTITKEQAEQMLIDDLKPFEKGVHEIAVSKFPNINQNQFDALVSYAYNRGLGASDGHNGLRQLIYNSDTLAEVSSNFVVYWGTNQNYYNGLINRRKKEQALFNTPVSEQPDENASIIEKAVTWAINVANDDTHGYSQENRDGNPDYDCSSLVYYAYENAGLNVINDVYYTGSMHEDFTNAGFEVFNYADVKNSLKRGDILWREGHTEICISSTQKVGAHSNYDGKAGDSGGNEINIKNISSSEQWVYVFRLPSNIGGGGGVTPDNPDTPITPTNNKRLSKLLLFAIATDDRF